MKKFSVALLAICLCMFIASCASHYKQGEKDIKKPVNCATAEADIRVLENEKVHASQQLAAGVSAIMPIGLVAGVATGTEGAKAKVATGDYNKMIDEKIAEIKKECGIE